MSQLGKIETFEASSGNIKRYLERLGQYFVANEIPEDTEEVSRRRAILISCIGGITYDTLYDLCSPDLPSDKTFNQLKEILEEHFAPKRLVIAERFRFYTCKQTAGESISDFIANLKKLAATCEFGNFLKDALRDIFVCGLKSSTIQKRLLSENKNLEDCLKIAFSMETAEKDIVEIQPNKASSQHVNQIQRRNKRTNNQPNPSSNAITGKPSQKFRDTKPSSQAKGYSCLSCGKSDHSRDECRYRNSTCYNCNRHGHITSACHNPKSKQSKPVHKVTRGEVDSDDQDTVSMFKINPHHSGIILQFRINHVDIDMELDTGSGVSIISENTYNSKFSDIILEPSDIVLHSYSGDKINVLGCFTTNITYGNQTVTNMITVVHGAGPSLIGRDLLSKVKLDWQNIFKVQSSVTSSIENIIKKYPDIFKTGLGTIQGIKATLNVKAGAIPKFFRARPVPYALQPAVDEELQRLESEGVIEKVDYSDWGTPMVHIPKSDGSTRSCGDYAITVNPQLNVPAYPIPLADDVFRKLQGGIKFSKLDLTCAYQQLLLDEESQQYVTINTHKGLYRYKRLPFGISSSPSIFQRTMDIILQGLEGIVCIQDDILVSGTDDRQHLANLEAVFQRLSKFGLRLKIQKCRFLQESVTYMGFIISKDGISPTDDKIKAIKDAPVPENVTQIRAFLGMVNYHGKFIPSLSSLLYPLNQLLQKDRSWKWTVACQKAFQSAKDALSSSHVLVHYNPSLPIILECDASQYGIGAVISHKLPGGCDRPIAYASRSLNSAEKNYSQIEKEALAIVFGVSKFYMYLYGRKFTLFTDHKPLLKILAPDGPTPVLAAARIQRWSLLLSSYTYDIKYKKSEDIANADALSRLPLSHTTDRSVEETIYSVSSRLDKLPITPTQISRLTSVDPVLSKVIRLTETGWMENCQDPSLKPYFHRKNELSIERGCLLWGLRVIIPRNLQADILQELHESHLGVVKMKSQARSYVWWPNIDTDIERIARDCNRCQQTRNNPARAPLTPWTWPSRPFQRVHIDFATHESQHFLILVDAYSKWPEVHGPMKTTNAEATINALRSIFARYGLPEKIVSDNGPPFHSAEYTSFLKNNGIQCTYVSPYHPASNGQAERFVQTFKNALKSSQLKNFSFRHVIDNFLLTYRSTMQSTTLRTPAELFLGRQLRNRLSLVRPNATMEVSQRQLSMKDRHDDRAKQRSFSLGEKVIVRDFAPNTKKKWQSGTIIDHHEPSTYIIQLVDGRIWKRHIDHIQKGSSQQDPEIDSDGYADIHFELNRNPDIENNNDDIPPDPVHPPAVQQEAQQPANATRSGRIVNPPNRLIQEI